MLTEFPPYKRRGVVFLTSMSLLLSGGIVALFLLALKAGEGVGFLTQIIGALILFVPLLYVLYRLYVQLSMHYSLQRDGLSIRWGLRREDIPIDSIEWIRPANEMGFHIPLPLGSLFGSILGKRSIEGLGVVAFIATQLDSLLLVATQTQVFAISPQDVRAFIGTYSIVNELGSLEPLVAQSIYPKFLLITLWKDKLARVLLLLGLVIVVILFAFVILTIPEQTSMVWFDGESAPSERMYLLPILNGLIWIGDFLAGAFAFRRGGVYRFAAYMLWFSSSFTGVMLFIAVLFL
ncbi:MAG: PH domain-containing protein [Anaerolineaceae bacterium]|nr:PH domain-containing protein [Anaerolineaceae bacterium]